MGYYIRYETHQDGPYDLVTMIRKIRKGLIPPETLVMEEAESSAVSARLHPQLNTFFRELEDDYVSEEAIDTIRQLQFGSLLAYGWNFFLHNAISGLYAALALFSTALLGVVTLIFTDALLPSLLMTIFSGGFSLCGFVFLMQRLQRQLPFSFYALFHFYKEHWRNITLFAIAFATLSFTGFLLFIIPGIWFLSRYLFAPILVVDRQYHFWHALESSRKTISHHGQRLPSILIGFVLLNMLAALCFVLPLLITLPITFVVLLEVYEQLDFK